MIRDHHFIRNNKKFKTTYKPLWEIQTKVKLRATHSAVPKKGSLELKLSSREIQIADVSHIIYYQRVNFCSRKRTSFEF